ncbi:MAG TPA: ferritin [Candidatus Sumerlaeota bacterium]|nr:MAG: Ferritin-1 [candidate division BRC1 bacterium ADurb.Bin183]HOE62637.1 ferritin [Candidatus Sumerlaeota bacterium]HRR31056.1 ferritin [Candidatus Sumerlaeia bacterium]HON49397.1 ferritin [Candidatus Sumerlaeota bacterium]HOR64854.1 ferritin [Candidatus Sumerlaeota bacterium]
MISKKMTEALNKQINAELFSAYLYQAMSAWLSWKNLNGFAKWFTLQAQEEQSHAMKIYEYVNDQGERVILEAIDAPQTDYASVKAVAEEQLKHEKKVTALINNLVKLAREEKDVATEIFLQWFISEQVEEERNAEEIINKLEMIGDKGPGMYMLDKEMGARE